MKLINPSLKHFFSAAALVCVSIVSAEAQSLKSLGSFQPSVISSEGMAQGVYNHLSTSIFKLDSACFQRAHSWAFQMSQRSNINSMKVFLFFTERYKREFNYVWNFHVAPLIPVQKADGSIQEMVFDPTFTASIDNKPLSISEWTKYFIFPDTECPVVETYQEFINFQDRYYCYIMKTPMFTYNPSNLQNETEARNQWNTSDLEQMKKAYQ